MPVPFVFGPTQTNNNETPEINYEDLGNGDEDGELPEALSPFTEDEEESEY